MDHPRPQAVGADHVPGADIDSSAAAVVPVYARHPAAAVPLHAGHGDAVGRAGIHLAHRSCPIQARYISDLLGFTL
jgi:hypothetical protein